MFQCAPARFKVRALLALLTLLTLLPMLCWSQPLTLDHRMNERVLMLPADTSDAKLETTIFMPDGGGPFPILIINHGKDAGSPRRQARERFYHMARSFVERGYAVLVPMRQGFAGSGGQYQQHGCDMTANGLAQARDIAATLDWVRAQFWADAERIVVAGQSFGGLATIALGTTSLPGVRGLMNVAGGLRDSACAWRSALVSAFASYGAHSQLPSLWLYGQNDTLFAPDLARQMHAAYTSTGGRAELVELPPFKRDAHGMLASRDGESFWLAPTERFLQAIGMPVERRYQVAPLPTPAPSSFARLDDVTAVPYLSEAGRAAYRAYLDKNTPRAFAVSPSGAWTWAEEGEDPMGRALATCSATSGTPCQLYSVDQAVVWTAREAQMASDTRAVDAWATSASGASQAP